MNPTMQVAEQQERRRGIPSVRRQHRSHSGAFSSPRICAESLIPAGATIMTVWAHPDDESYLSAGIMAAAASKGSRVVNVTATMGEHGTDDPMAMPPGLLAGIRRDELDAALAALGVHESVHLGYEDGTLSDVDITVGARRIATVLDEIEPDLVISFGPDGFTGHPDHIAVGAWTDLAVNARRVQPALLHTAIGRCLPEDLIAAMDELDAFFPGFVPEPRRAVDVELRLDEAEIEAKLNALASHRSQTERFRLHLGDAAFRRLAATEAYSPANARALALTTGHAALAVA